MRMWDENLWGDDLEEKDKFENVQNVGKCRRNGDNRHSSVIWFKARSNALQLADMKKFVLGRTECVLCGVKVEEAEHFLLQCPGLEELMRTSIHMQKPRVEKVEVTSTVLFENPEKWKKEKKSKEDVEGEVR